MANEYLIPFGVDASKFFDGLNSIDKGTDATAANVEEATKQMQKGFNDAATAGDKLGSTMSVDAEKAAALRDQAKTLGKELGDALNGKNVTGDFEKRLQKFNDLLVKFSNNAVKPIKFNIDTAKLEQFEKMLAEGGNELQVLNQVITVTKQQLSTLNPDSEEFAELNAQLQIAESFLGGLGDAAAGAEVKQKSLKGQLREMKAALAEMEIAGKGNTDEFRQLSIRAGEVEDQIGDVSARVRVLASDTKYIDAGVQAIQGLAGAFTAAQGAAALFGGENEEVQKVIQKVTGAMAVLQGIQAVANALNKDSALSVLLFSRSQQAAVVSTTALAGAEAAQAGATVAATTATRGFTAALLANPIFLIVAAVAALVTALIAFSDGSEDAEEATKRFNDELERQKTLLELDENSLKRRTDLLVAQAKATGKAESDITTIEGQALAERINLRRAAYNDLVKIYNDSKTRAKLSAEDNKKLEDDLIKSQQQLADDENELQIKRIERDGQRKKEQEELSKKAIEDAKKAAEIRKQILEQQIKYTSELEKARIDNLKEGYEKERQQATQAVTQRIAELQAEKSLSAKAELDKQELIKQLRLNLTGQLAEINKKQAADEAALAFKAQQLTIQYREDGIVKEVETIRLGYLEKKKEIEEQFKNETDLREELIAQLNDAEVRETKKAVDEFKIAQIKSQEEQAVLEVETAKKFLPDLPGIEEQKQVAILEVKLRYAEKALQTLKDQGNAENSIAVLQAQKNVNDLTKALEDGRKKLNVTNQPRDILDLFGIKFKDDKGNDLSGAVKEAAAIAYDSIGQITDFIVGQYQRQIDKKQEVIDQIDQSISDLEEQLDEEKQLQEDGFANNVGIIQAEIDEKKKAKEEELKQQQELQKKQEQVQKAQIALDTAVQASNLVTSATSIFKTLAPLGPFGVGLAITTIALMTAAFVAAKIAAFQAVSDQKQTFGGGGWIDGKPHSQGGKKYRAIDGSGDVVELEGGEHVTRKGSATKYADLLEAINSDNLAGMGEEALRDMLQGMGIHLSSEAPKQVIKVVRERNEYKQAALMAEAPGADLGDDVRAINENVAYLAQRERERVERWEDDKFYYFKDGNRTTKIKK